MKTNFIENLKQLLFLIIAILGTFISYSQPLQNLSVEGSNHLTTDKTDMGGSKSSDGDLLNSYCKVNAECTFVTKEDVGGRGTGGTGTDSGTGQYDDDFGPYDRGGKNTPGDLGLLVIQNDMRPSITTHLSSQNLVTISLEYRPGIGCNLDTDLGGAGKGTSAGGGQHGDDDDDPSGRPTEEYSFFVEFNQ